MHFIGIGGISCNALAKFVLDFGGKVSGSDAKSHLFATNCEQKVQKFGKGKHLKI